MEYFLILLEEYKLLFVLYGKYIILFSSHNGEFSSSV